ncbi:Uncharacterised protein [Mycobacteroides abscessus subsp. abscessus]|nr:Uncharacterised protein [Mycobacteroides abscessus subsp. abscessus]
MSNNDWQQAPDPTGQAPQYQQPPQYQIPNDASSMGYANGMPPEKKSKTGLWIGLGCGALLILLLIAGGVLAFVLLSGKDKEASEPKDDTTTSAAAPAPAPNAGGSDTGGDTPKPAPAPDPGANPAPDPGGVPAPDPGGVPAPDPGGVPAPDPGGVPAPDPGGVPAPDPGGNGGGSAGMGSLPPKVGDLTADPSVSGIGLGEEEAGYMSPDKQTVYIVSIVTDSDMQEMLTKYSTGEKKAIGNWQCAQTSDISGSCYATGPNGKLVYISAGAASGLPMENVAAWGDQLLSQMK